jgi:Probable cobalt transporter subunit (CbtA)
MGSLGSVLKAAVVAGLIAGAITAGFHTLLLEPLIERAIDLEEHASQPHGQAMREPLIDRPTQRWGLLILFWTILGGAFARLLRDASAPSPVEKGRA